MTRRIRPACRASARAFLIDHYVEPVEEKRTEPPAPISPPTEPVQL